jgi:hypothetical protein
MRKLSEYNENTSNYELFSFLHDRIINREVTTFSQLKSLVEPLLSNKRIHPVIMRAFELVKRLYWGFFAGISPVTHQKLWSQLVIPDTLFPDAGDMKRTISISNLYVVMMDIHGYTKFCQSTRNNLSMLHNLDKTINTTIRLIAAQCQSECRREQGDEIVLVAASATDALTSAIGIIDYFAKTNILNDPSVTTKRIGAATALPVFNISAGIAGGNTTIPLIITEQGDLSGFLLNTAARLQSHANTLSPKESRLMITKQVEMNFVKENQRESLCSHIAKNEVIYFFDTGMIEFKGVLLPTCEAIFDKNDQYKQRFSGEMSRLFDSVRTSQWEHQIFSDLMDLLVRSSTVMLPFSIELKEPLFNTTVVNNDTLVRMCQTAKKSYMNEDYSYAVMLLHEFTSMLEQIPRYDHLILDYLKGITEKYDFILNMYNESIDKEIEANARRIFSDEHLKTYFAAKNATDLLEKLLSMGRTSPELRQKRILWHNLIQLYKDSMVFTLYSGKK